MSTPTLPSTNGLISDPTARKIIGNVFGWALLAVLAAGVVDAALATVDFSAITVPATGIIGGLFALFQLTSTSPNVPTPAAVAKATAEDPTGNGIASNGAGTLPKFPTE